MRQPLTLDLYDGSKCISWQIRDQGYYVSSMLLAIFELDNDAIGRLHMRGLLTDNQTKNSRKKLIKRILKYIKAYR